MKKVPYGGHTIKPNTLNSTIQTCQHLQLMLGVFEQVCSLISETLCPLLSIHYSFHLCTNSLLYLMVLICQLPI